MCQVEFRLLPISVSFKDTRTGDLAARHLHTTEWPKNCCMESQHFHRTRAKVCFWRSVFRSNAAITSRVASCPLPKTAKETAPTDRIQYPNRYKPMCTVSRIAHIWTHKNSRVYRLGFLVPDLCRNLRPMHIGSHLAASRIQLVQPRPYKQPSPTKQHLSASHPSHGPSRRYPSIYRRSSP